MADVLKPELEIALGCRYAPNQRWADIRLGGVTIFSELVYDTPEHSAEENILRLFASRLRKVIEEDYK